MRGTLAWVASPVLPYPEATLGTVDRHGQVTPLPAPVRSYGAALRVSPDGRRLAVTVRTLTEVGFWVYDLERRSLTLLNRDGEVFYPVWAPDGRHLVFCWLTDGRFSLATQPADGTAPPRDLLTGDYVPSSFTPHGRRVAAVREMKDIVNVSLENGKASVQSLIETPARELFPEISPDGRWLAYVSGVAGRGDVYVRPYPGSGPAESASPDGGGWPAWHPRGRELFFVSRADPTGARRMMAVEFAPGLPLRLGRPRPLFAFDPRAIFLLGDPVRSYDVALDGQRFYAVQYRMPRPAPPVTHINLIQNWVEELKAKVPSGTREAGPRIVSSHSARPPTGAPRPGRRGTGARIFA